MRNHRHLSAGLLPPLFLISLVMPLLNGCSGLWPGKVPPPGAIQMQGVNESPARQQYFEQLAIPMTTANE